MLYPKKLTKLSQISLVHTSSPVERKDLGDFKKAIEKIQKDYPMTKFFDVERNSLDPRYLSASGLERLRKLRKALKKVDWLLPVYGGTGCADIVRKLSPEDLSRIKKRRPIVSGFSDSTFLINYLYFKLKLLTFSYANACGLYDHDNNKLFFDIISGTQRNFSFKEESYKWIGHAGAPEKPIEGFCIGGNFSTFRDMLDIGEINPRSWEDYILFIEELDMDLEDLHRIVISLDQRGVFRHIKALVIGKMNEKKLSGDYRRFNSIFNREPEEKFTNVFEYLISDVLKKRMADNDPLYILKVENFGHGLNKNTMILPIGGKTVIHPDKKIEFVGPFVE
ncbi:MAG TPA: LD-carboxypeptidase [Candidatus Magasanikbacteria bacterium]|nr:LD-carboxypeptidase [Candidatus Magasanikbacteria bacterium]